MSKGSDTATRARRLLALLPHLRQGETTLLADLAAAVGCTPVEVAVDLATLTMCGVPPFTPFDMIELHIDGDSVTVDLDPPAIARPLRLTIAEARALGAALDAAGFAPGSALRRKLLEAAADTVSTDELERTVRAGTAPGGIADLYATVAAAAEEHEKVRVTYLTGSTGRISERVVHPWALVNRLGTWYLVAWCEDAREERVFRLDRIREARRTGDRFAPPTAVPYSVTPEPDRQPIAEIRFPPGAYLPDERSWPGVVLEMSQDGSTVARMPYQTVSWIARRVVARLGEAEALAPAEVRDAVRTLAGAALTETTGRTAPG